MKSKDKQRLKRIYFQLNTYAETMNSILEQLRMEEEKNMDDDYDPVPDQLEDTVKYLYRSYYALEDVVNS